MKEISLGHIRPLTLTDQIGQRLEFKAIPSRIVCCVPSITEYLFDIGLDVEILGRTKFCIHPKEKIGHIPKIGGTKNLDIEKIKSLNPDFIIANKEENTKSDIQMLMPFCNTYVSDVKNIEDALIMMAALAKILDKIPKYAEFKKQFDEKRDGLITKEKTTKCVYLIWQNPNMTVGGDTYINSMLSMIGFENINAHEARYPIVEDLDAMVKGVSHILLSTEPYPFKNVHLELYEKRFPNHKVILVNGEYFSWYGSRMLKALDYFKNSHLFS